MQPYALERCYFDTFGVASLVVEAAIVQKAFAQRPVANPAILGGLMERLGQAASIWRPSIVGFGSITSKGNPARRRDGPDRLFAVHEGMPVAAGTKYIITIWHRGRPWAYSDVPIYWGRGPTFIRAFRKRHPDESQDPGTQFAPILAVRVHGSRIKSGMTG